MTIDITEIIIALIGLLSVIITSVIVPWIKSKTTVNQQEIIRTIVTVSVYAAQQLFDTDDEKKEYALREVTEALAAHNIKISTSEISTYIEGVLKNIKTELSEEVNW